MAAACSLLLSRAWALLMLLALCHGQLPPFPTSRSLCGDCPGYASNSGSGSGEPPVDAPLPVNYGGSNHPWHATIATFQADGDFTCTLEIRNGFGRWDTPCTGTSTMFVVEPDWPWQFLPGATTGASVRLTEFTCNTGPCDNWSASIGVQYCDDNQPPMFTMALDPNDWGTPDTVFDCTSPGPENWNVNLPPGSSLPPTDLDDCFVITKRSFGNLYKFHNGQEWVNGNLWAQQDPGTRPAGEANCQLTVSHSIQQYTSPALVFPWTQSLPDNQPSSDYLKNRVFVYDHEPPVIEVLNPAPTRECDGTSIYSWITDISDGTDSSIFRVQDSCWSPNSIYGDHRTEVFYTSFQVPKRPELGPDYFRALEPGCGRAVRAEVNITVMDPCGWTADPITVVLDYQDTMPPDITGPTAAEVGPFACMAAAPTPQNLVDVYMFDPLEVSITATDECDFSGVTVGYTDSAILCTVGETQITREHWARDSCGREAARTQTIRISGTPTVTFSPSNQNQIFECGAGDANFTVTAMDSCLGDVSALVECFESIPVHDATCPGAATFEKHCMVAAMSGCSSAEIIYQVGVEDTTPPDWTFFPDSLSVECAVESTDPVDTGEPSAEDSCLSTVSITSSDNPTTGMCGSEQRIFRTWFAEDQCTNVRDSVQVISVRDRTPPTIEAPPPISVPCSASRLPADLNGEATGMDACGSVAITYSDGVLTPACDASFYRTWTASDGCNMVQESQLITLVDEGPPMFDFVPASLDLQCGLESPSDFGLTGTATASDDCFPPDVTFSDSTTPNCGATQTIIRTWIATDECMGTTMEQQTIDVVDTIPPVIDPATAPNRVVLQCTEDLSPSGAAGSLEAVDACGGVSVTFVDAEISECSPTTFQRTLVRDWTATDLCGLTTLYSQTIFVFDPAAPTFPAPPDIDVECGMEVPELNGGPPPVSENCPFGVTMTYSDVDLTPQCGLAYSIRRTWVADDGCYQTTSVQTVTEEDTTPPELTAPGDITYQCGIPPDFGVATATDLCDDNVQITTSTMDPPGPGSCGGETVLVREFEARDACDLISTGSQTITSVDTLPPVFASFPPSVQVECVGSSLDSVLAEAGQAIAEDACSSADDVMVFPNDNIVQQCGLTLRVERQWRAVDGCGNTALRSQTIAVVDTTPPDLEVPPTVTFECDRMNPPDTSPAVPATADDVCSGPLEVQYRDSVSATCGSSYRVDRLWWVRDECGLRSEATQRVFVRDLQIPTFTMTPDDYKAECGAVQSLAPGPVTGFAAATDNCAPTVDVSYQDRKENGCGGTYTVFRTWRARDGCTENSLVQQLTLEDTTKPELVGPLEDVEVECGVGDEGAVEPPAVRDSCTPEDELVVEWDDDMWMDGCGGTRTKTRTWTVTDACGNELTDLEQRVAFVDTTPPEMSLESARTVVECDASAALPEVRPSASDACGAVASVAKVGTPHEEEVCGRSREITTEWEAMDECGLTSRVEHVLEVRDTQDPLLEVPPPLTLECTAALSVQPGAVAVATATDACTPDEVELEYEDTFEAECGSSVSAGMVRRRWVARDACGHESDAIQLIEVVDTAAPAISLGSAASVQLECGESTHPDAVGRPAVADACDANPRVTHRDRQRNGRIERVWTAEDACGNERSVTQIITVDDTEAPMLTVPADVELACSSSVDTRPERTGMASAVDVCAGQVSVEYEDVCAEGCGGSYVIERTWKAMDDAGNEATGVQRITVSDEAPPTVRAPRDLDVECGASLEVAALPTGDAAVSDTCSGWTLSERLEVRQVQCGGGGVEHGAGVYERVWTAVDECMNEASDTQRITVRDTQPPQIDAAPSVDVPCPSSENDLLPGGALVPAVGASEVCGELTLSYEDTERTLTRGCEGERLVRRVWTAEDGCGLSSQRTQSIFVRDTEGPVVTAPGSVTLECGTELSVEATGSAVAADACGSVRALTYSDAVDDIASAALAPCGWAVARTWRAEDACGFAATAVQAVVLMDTLAPTVEAPPDRIVECGAGDASSGVDAHLVEAWDACTKRSALSVTAQDVEVERLCGAGSEARVIARTWSVKDECQLEATSVQRVTVRDSVRPQLYVPEHAVVECGADSSPAETGEATAVDACDMAVAVTYSDALEVQCGASGVANRAWVATDACGNEQRGTQRINVVDRTAPTFVSVPPDQVLECQAGASLGVAETGGSATAEDACGAVAVTFNERSTALCGGTRRVLRMWRGVDQCGLAASHVQTLETVDTMAPTFTLDPTEVTLECSSAAAAAVLAGGGVDALPRPVDVTDACDPDGVSLTYADTVSAGGCANEAVVERVWRATDGCGQMYEETQIIRIVDTVPPVLDVPESVQVSCSEGRTPKVTGKATAVDACSGSVLPTYSDIMMDGACGITDGVIRRTWLAVDECGNAVNGTQHINVTDMSAPLLVRVPPPTAAVECGPTADTSEANLGTVVATDDCAAIPTVEMLESPFEVACGTAGAFTRTWNVTDGCEGPVTQAEQRIVVVDTREPTFTFVPMSTTVECGGAVPSDMATAEDECSNSVKVVRNETVTPICGGAREIVRTWRAVDECFLERVAFETVAVVDTMAPEFESFTKIISLECTKDAQSTLPVNTGYVNATDICTPHPEVQFVDGSFEDGKCEQEFAFVREWTAVDECGNEKVTQQRIEVHDMTPPTVMLDELEHRLECTAALLERLADKRWANVTVRDSCDETPSLEFVDAVTLCSAGAPMPSAMVGVPPMPPGGSKEEMDCTDCGGDGCTVLNRQWVARDACGNEGIAALRVCICDTTPPQLTVPAAVEVECGSDTSVEALGWAEAADDCAAVEVVWVDEVVLEDECMRVTERKWVAVDMAGLRTNGTQMITEVDTGTPVLEVPPDVVVECGSEIPASAFAPANATDSCGSGNVMVSERMEVVSTCDSSDEGGARVITRYFTALDGCGNSASAEQRIEVVDTTEPELRAPGHVTAECGTEAAAAVAATTLEQLSAAELVAAVAANDTCGAVSVRWEDEVVSEQCAGLVTAVVRTWIATDACGLEARDTQVVEVVDTQAPQLVVPANTNVECDTDTSPAALGLFAMAVDACDAAVQVEYNDIVLPSSCVNEARLLRRWTARDACGNGVAGEQVVEVVDTSPPRFVGSITQEETTMLCERFEPMLERQEVDADRSMVVDNCGAVTRVFVQDLLEEAPQCLEDVQVVRVWDAMDECGLSIQQQQTFVLKAAMTLPPLVNPGGNDTTTGDGDDGGSEDDSDGGDGEGEAMDVLTVCRGLSGIALQSCLSMSKVVVVDDSSLEVELEVEGRQVGTIALPRGVAGSLLVVGPSFAPDVGRESEVVEITLVAADGSGESPLTGDVEICLELEEESSRDDLCLAFYDTAREQWQCQQDCLEVEDRGRRCANSTHLTSFAILLGGDGGGDTDCGGTDNQWITGEWAFDFLLILLTVGFVVLMAAIAIIFFLTPYGKEKFYGKEGTRILMQRSERQRLNADVGEFHDEGDL